jgi:hypothetical protein
MKRIFAIVLAGLTAVSVLSVSLFAGTKPAPQPTGFAMLKSIKSPQELLFPSFPKRYCVPVTLSGKIADEMKGALDSLKLEPPQYSERFDGNAFNLILANENYSGKTRELLGGIMNPVELIDIVVSSVLKYREPQKYAEIINDTKLTQDTATYKGKRVMVIRLSPKGERFGYLYQDVGAFVHESWLTMLTITLDASTKVVYELSTIRYSRTYDANAERPAADIMNARYMFFYEQQDSVLLPTRLNVFFNNAEVLKIEASYRKQDKFFVFDKKEICSSLDGVASCLDVSYGDYRFKGCDSLLSLTKNQDKNYSKNLEKAAALSEEASEKLRNGQITESVRVLQKLVDQYGDTPQAVEARRLLSQLPRELH